jgi:hypothetical protein
MMAMTFPLAVPNLNHIRSVRFTLLDVVGGNESPYTLSQETYEHAGKRFAIEVDLIPMRRADAEQWVAFLAALRGRRGTFLLGDPVGQTARGIATGTPLVKGAGQTGGTLLTDGWTISTTGILKAGDWIQLGSGSTSRLHKVLQDANSDGSGNATLELWPGPRTAPADNAAIVVASTKSVWRLTGNERSYDIQTAQIFGISFSAVEAL